MRMKGERHNTMAILSGLPRQTGYVCYLLNMDGKTTAEVISGWGLQLSGHQIYVSLI